jgi:serine/arginine repetitive matrix protein 2
LYVTIQLPHPRLLLTTRPTMSTPSSAAQTRLNFRSSPHSAAAATRNSIINSSAHGWSPLKIAKRDDSPLKSPGMSDQGESPGLDASPRRTSSSFKHVTKNSLVSNSIFKQSTTPAGLNPAEERVIHERAGRRGMGEAPTSASGVASTPKASIGLGISANAKPRSASRSASGGRSSIGVRRVSTDRTKASPSASGDRRVSGERVVSGSKENESPDIRSSGKRVPRQSMGLKGLARNEYVSKSPFRRVPSGGLSSASSTRANESPTHPSPKSIPLEKDDLFSSPSPSASKRRASPSKFRTRNTSPTPSPPRGIAQSTLASAVVPSPLGQGQTLAVGSYSDISPSPTPIKSSMTPSRRLKGPRDYSDASYDSPTKSKTVTFHAVPEVKEFEAAAGETATPDVSFEQGTQSEGEDEGEWADEDLRDDSLEHILHEPETLEKAFGRQQYRVTNPDAPTQELSEDGHVGVGDESATAEFMDTLISEGLFSPPELSTPAFEDYSQFHLSDGPAPFLSTPSMGDSVHATPMLAGVEPETDGAGIPYGRTHHAERNVAAHSQFAPVRLEAPIPQPAIPHGGDHTMLPNSNASQPALAPVLVRSNADQLAHQSGTIPDPFLTIQTATNVLNSKTDREEDGIPLGRTSHIERMQAARMLATQSLGIGMPRSPGVSQTFAIQQAAARPAQPSSSSSADGESVDSEMLFDASFELGMSDDGEENSPAPTRLAPLQQTVAKEEKMEAAANGRRLPKPPRVEEIKLPSPVSGRSISFEGSSPEDHVKVSPYYLSKQAQLTGSRTSLTFQKASVCLLLD